jgi:hypothetical protein
LWTALASGALVGAILSALTDWPGIGAFQQKCWGDFAVRRICVHAGIGAIAGSCFWLVRVRSRKMGGASTARQ